MNTLPMSRLNERMITQFDDFFRPWNEWFSNESPLTKTTNIPAVNIVEKENEFLVSLAVPGFKKSDFKLNVEGNLLTISSENENKNEEKNERFTRMEYNYSSFSRTFTLPENIDKEKITATYEDGVLKISLPRTENNKQTEVKKIAVN